MLNTGSYLSNQRAKIPDCTYRTHTSESPFKTSTACFTPIRVSNNGRLPIAWGYTDHYIVKMIKYLNTIIVKLFILLDGRHWLMQLLLVVSGEHDHCNSIDVMWMANRTKKGACTCASEPVKQRSTQGACAVQSRSQACKQTTSNRLSLCWLHTLTNSAGHHGYIPMNMIDLSR